MPRFMMGALAVTSVCVGYLLATRWEDSPATGMQEVAPNATMTSGPPGASDPHPRRRRPGSVYGDVPLGI